jgi:hypothetical protein
VELGHKKDRQTEETIRNRECEEDGTMMEKRRIGLRKEPVQTALHVNNAANERVQKLKSEKSERKEDRKERGKDQKSVIYMQESYDPKENEIYGRSATKSDPMCALQCI